MAGLIDSFMQGYINRVNAQNGGGRAANNTLAAQNTASAFQRLQDAISQDYSQQQAQAKALVKTGRCLLQLSDSMTKCRQ